MIRIETSQIIGEDLKIVGAVGEGAGYAAGNLIVELPAGTVEEFDARIGERGGKRYTLPDGRVYAQERHESWDGGDVNFALVQE
jgi:hypothetical protein